MGQYYKPCNIDTLEYLYSHEFDNGLKLMEHSYIGNNFVEAVERLLSPGGPWHKCHLCWAGDYMDAGLFLPEGHPIKDEKGYDINLYSVATTNAISAIEKLKPKSKDDYVDPYSAPVKTAVAKWVKKLPKKGRYLVNHTKKVCLDLTAENNPSDSEYIIHPLPLLTCSGNGRGGGDYHGGTSFGEIGSWAGDEISMEHEVTYELKSPINFCEQRYS